MADQTFWTPTLEWKGFPVVVVATGPSLTLAQVRTIGLARRSNRCRVIAVKDSVLLAWWADILFAADARYWTRRWGWKDFHGRRVGLAESPNPARYELLLLQRTGFEGCDLRPGYVATHGNSGAMAVQLAAQLSDDKIVLAGFDMKPGVDERHWFGENEWGPPRRNMDNWASSFRAIADALPGRIWTVTADSALDYLPVVDDLAVMLGI